MKILKAVLAYILCNFCCCWWTFLDALPSEPRYTPVVHLNNGLGAVRGLMVEADAGRLVNFYQGIRYGYAARFQKPIPVKAWTGVYNATHWRYACPQPEMVRASSHEVSPTNWLQLAVYSEDCLFLNVWQPTQHQHPETLYQYKTANSTAKAVMVWIHGTGFTYGTIFSAQYDARQIAALGDVVVVSVGYRLGPFGFLNGGTREEAGNSGLYDQVLALQWVQQHIDQFGGDPKRVTIFGESSGAMSVGILTLSPMTSGLFQRAIMQSGAPNSFLGSEPRGVSLHKTRIMGVKMGCPPSSPRQTVNCMRTKSVEDIVRASKEDFQQLTAMLPVFGERLLPIPPVQALRQFSRPVDLLFGVVRDEGSIFINYFFPQIPLEEDKLSLGMVKAAIRVMMSQVSQGSRASLVAVDHYTSSLSENSTPKQLRTAISDTFGDFSTVCPTVLFGEQIAKRLTQLNANHRHDPSHLYAYRVMTPISSPFIKCPIETMGVCHGQDNVYLFGHPISFNGVPPFGNFSQQQIELSRQMISAWTQFAKSGQIEPLSGVEWKPVHTWPNNFTIDHFSFDFGEEQQQQQQQQKQAEVDQDGQTGVSFRMVNSYWDKICGKLWKPIIFR